MSRDEMIEVLRSGLMSEQPDEGELFWSEGDSIIKFEGEGYLDIGFVADLVEYYLVEKTGGPQHIIELRETDWTMQHPVTERFEGTLLDCPYTRWTAWSSTDEFAMGRFYCTLNEYGTLVVGEEVQPDA